MEATRDWTRTVFRLRNLPSSVRNPAEAASLLSSALGLPTRNVIVYSLARSLDKWEKRLSKCATLQLTAVPQCLRSAKEEEDEWIIHLPGNTSDDVLILDTHFKGMTALNDVDPTRHLADCVAISGLASHPFGSWQPRGRDKTFMWIRDTLPASVPGLRAVVYGYESSLAENTSFQSIADMGRFLILHLKSGGWNLQSSKPIIFLAHSLGGLVLKEAIVQAASGEKSIASILDNILGAIMFGVPSLGMDQSHLMAMVEGKPNEFLVQDLSRDGGSNYVRQLHTQFEGLSFLRKARILWAFETKVSPTVVRGSDGAWTRTGPSTVIVNPESATSHCYRTNRSLTIPINENHSNMVKFPRGDANLRVVIHSIREYLTPNHPLGPLIDSSTNETHTSKSNDDIQNEPSDIYDLADCEGEDVLRQLAYVLRTLDDMRKKLYAPELGSRIEQVEDPFENTFKWIFDVPSFSNWLQDGTGLFWIHGKPGSGKSTLMKLIYESKETWELLHKWGVCLWEVKAGFFFHHRGSALQKSFEGILRSLIIQIIPPYHDAFRKQHVATVGKYRALKDSQERAEQRRQVAAKNLEAIDKKIDELRARRMARRMSEFDEAQDSSSHEELRQIEDGLRDLSDQREDVLLEQTMCDVEVGEIRASISSLASSSGLKPADPWLSLLSKVTAAYSEQEDGLILRLERILLTLLDQDLTRMDLVLFLDALDEFDGNLDFLSRFLKGLTQNSSSKTSVKICFSSRPWESLKSHFSTSPGFALQDYTKDDIERFAAGTLAKSDTTSPLISQLAPSIIARADGVFLWVKLAIKELVRVVMSSPGPVSTEILESRLRSLPEDLWEFYELIIGRISAANRRRTFALLELLTRHTGRSLNTVEVRDAVLVSGCNSYLEAKDVLGRAKLKRLDGSIDVLA